MTFDDYLITIAGDRFFLPRIAACCWIEVVPDEDDAYLISEIINVLEDKSDVEGIIKGDIGLLKKAQKYNKILECIHEPKGLSHYLNQEKVHRDKLT